MRSRRRHGIALMVAVGLTTALSGCTAFAGTSVTPTASAAAPATGASAPPLPVVTAATPVPRKAAPALATTGTAWPAILTSLAGYGQWLLANPDPALVGNIAMQGCTMYDLIYRQADALLRDKAYLVPSPPVFAVTAYPSLAPGTTAAALGGKVVLNVTASRPAEVVMSRTGKQISTFDQLPPTSLQITLQQGTDLKWRFCNVNAMADTGAPDDPSVPLL